MDVNNNYTINHSLRESKRELQSGFGFTEARKSSYRSQGNYVLKRVHDTMNTMLDIYTDVQNDKWAELLPFAELAHNTAYSITLEETPQFLMFGRRATLAVYAMLGVLSNSGSDWRLEHWRCTVNNLQISYYLARRNPKTRSGK